MPLRLKKKFIWNLVALFDWFCPKWWYSRIPQVKLGILCILAKHLQKCLSLASVLAVFTDTVILCGCSWMKRIKKLIIFQDLKVLRQLVLLSPCQHTTQNAWWHPRSKIISCLSYEFPNIWQKRARKKETNIDADNYRKSLLACPKIECKLLTHRSAFWPLQHTAFPRDLFLWSKCIFHKYWLIYIVIYHQNFILSTVKSLLCIYTVIILKQCPKKKASKWRDVI